MAPGADATSKLLFARNPDLSAPGPEAVVEAPSPMTLSPDLAGKLAEGGPRYQPAPAAPASGVGPDLRTVDRPKNDIPRLPVEMMGRYVVKGGRPELLQGRDLYTEKELVNLEFKEHPGLRFGNFLGLNRGFGYEMFLEEERLVKLADLKDTAMAIAAGGDAAEAQAIMDAAAEAYMRTESVEGPVGIK